VRVYVCVRVRVCVCACVRVCVCVCVQMNAVYTWSHLDPAETQLLLTPGELSSLRN